jgi:hypothetical protein
VLVVNPLFAVGQHLHFAHTQTFGKLDLLHLGSRTFIRRRRKEKEKRGIKEKEELQRTLEDEYMTNARENKNTQILGFKHA